MRLNLQFFFDLLSSVQYTDETPKLSLARHQATRNSWIGRREKRRTVNQFENDQSLGANSPGALGANSPGALGANSTGDATPRQRKEPS